MSAPTGIRERLAALMRRIECHVSNDAAHAQRELEAAEERRADERRARLDALRRLEPPIPGPMVSAIIRGELEATPALVAVRRWLMHPASRPVLVLHADHPCGKTVAAAEAAVTRPSSEWVSAYGLLTPYAADFGEPAAVWNRCLRARLLVVDHLEPNRGRLDTLMEALAVLVDQRKRYRTIITTRLTLSTLERTLDFAPLLELMRDADHVTFERPRSQPPPIPEAAKRTS